MKEIETCDSLVAYCISLKKKFGLILDSEEVARQLQEEQRKDQTRQQIRQKIDEGKLETSMSNAQKAAQ